MAYEKIAETPDLLSITVMIVSVSIIIITWYGFRLCLEFAKKRKYKKNEEEEEED